MRIVSGGQTGVDRAALDVAIELGLEHGGWCPQGRRAEDGAIAAEYRLRETESADYSVRTEANVRDSEATLILTWGVPSGGTALTIELARRLHRPSRVVDLADRPEREEAATWLIETGIATLNVAGPRESRCPGIYAAARAYLRRLLLRFVPTP